MAVSKRASLFNCLYPL